MSRSLCCNPSPIMFILVPFWELCEMEALSLCCLFVTFLSYLFGFIFMCLLIYCWVVIMYMFDDLHFFYALSSYPLFYLCIIYHFLRYFVLIYENSIFLFPFPFLFLFIFLSTFNFVHPLMITHRSYFFFSVTQDVHDLKIRL